VESLTHNGCTNGLERLAAERMLAEVVPRRTPSNRDMAEAARVWAQRSTPGSTSSINHATAITLKGDAYGS
jgi:hypothetical protein